MPTAQEPNERPRVLSELQAGGEERAIDRQRELELEAELHRQRRGQPGVIRRLLRRARKAIWRRS